jgi:hypothetical protein
MGRGRGSPPRPPNVDLRPGPESLIREKSPLPHPRRAPEICRAPQGMRLQRFPSSHQQICHHIVALQSQDHQIYSRLLQIFNCRH